MSAADVEAGRRWGARGRTVAVVRSIVTDRAALAGLILLGLVLLGSAAGPFLYGGHADARVAAPLIPPLTPGAPLLGTDSVGRDTLAQLLVGGPPTLAVGVLAAAISVLVGTTVGGLAGFFGGWIDAILMRVTELVLVIPLILFAIAILAFVPATDLNIAAVIGALSWPMTARVARAEFLRLRELDFVTSARVVGASDSYLMWRVILPNALSPLLVMASLAVAGAILVAAGLSFVGLVDPNQPSWGLMLAFNRSALLYDPWPTTFAGLAIFVTVLGVGLLADGLNDALNPRLRQS